MSFPHVEKWRSSGGGCCSLSAQPILKLCRRIQFPLIAFCDWRPSHIDFLWWDTSGSLSINSFIRSTGQHLVLLNAFWFLCLSVWLFGKHFSFVITWCLDGNAWIVLLKLFAFSYSTSASGMSESINTVYLVNYLCGNMWERAGIISGAGMGWQLESESRGWAATFYVGTPFPAQVF